MDWLSLGRESQTDFANFRLLCFGNFRTRVGQFNPALTTNEFFGTVAPYHRFETRSGSPDENGPAELADHTHIVWRNTKNLGSVAPPGSGARPNPMPQHRQYWQGVYTAGGPTDTGSEVASMVFHGGVRDIRGTALANEISIDTTATTPSGALNAGDVVFRHSSNPNVLAGQRFILEVTQQTVAGIQAAMYNATVVTPSAETSPGSGIWQYTLSVQGLDALHWTATAGTPGVTQQGLSTLTGNYSVALASTLAVSQIAVPSVSGDPHLLDVTLTATPPSMLIVGHVFSIQLRSDTNITGLPTSVWIPGTVVSVVGNVVRVRLGGSEFGLRFRKSLTIGGGPDTNTTLNVAASAVRDSQHDIVQGYILSSQYRNSNGVSMAMGFGSAIFGESVQRSVAVGMDLFVGDNDTWVAGTSQTGNRMELVGNVLRVNGTRVGANGVAISRIRHGRSTLVSGTVTVSDANVTANSRIFLTHAVISGSHGWLHVSARVAGTSFTITSSNGGDTSQVDWMIIEP